ncbi:MAG: hypothetical protein ACRD5H_13645 [Nitrososphaerales archaeon]
MGDDVEDDSGPAGEIRASEKVSYFPLSSFRSEGGSRRMNVCPNCLAAFSSKKKLKQHSSEVHSY